MKNFIIAAILAVVIASPIFLLSLKNDDNKKFKEEVV